VDDLSVNDYAMIELLGGDESFWEPLIPARPMVEMEVAIPMGLAERVQEVVE
jgi:hypothetical protein